MVKKIKVAILKTTDTKLEVNDSFEHSLENMQKVVGGYLEAVTLRHKGGRTLTLWLNEEGKFNGCAANFTLAQGNRVLDIVMGDVLFTSSSSAGNTISLNEEELKFIQSNFSFDPARGIHAKVLQMV